MEAKGTCIRLSLDEALARLPGPEGKPFATIFKHGTLLLEVYSPLGFDPQKPHTRDEVYFVAAGRGEFVCGESRQPFGPTDLLFAAAGVEHRFENFTQGPGSLGTFLWP